MNKDTIIKVRIDDFLKEKAKGAAELYNWSLSKYIRFLIMQDLDNRLYENITKTIDKNVDTKDEEYTLYHEGLKYKIVSFYQAKK